MRRRRRPTYTLPLLCLAALTAGGVLCAWQVAVSRRADVPAAVSPAAELRPADREGPAEMRAARPGSLPAVASSEAQEALPRETVVIDFLPFGSEPVEAGPGPDSPRQEPQPQEEKGPAGGDGAKKSSARRTEDKTWDLSAYRVKPRVADAASYLPGAGRSPDAEAVGGGAGKRNFDAGKGLAGDVYRGVRRLVASMDAATLEASKRVLSPIAKPAGAKIRPHGSGVRLRIDIPPETVKIR